MKIPSSYHRELASRQLAAQDERPLSLVYKLLKGFWMLLDMSIKDYDWIVASKHRDRLLVGAMHKPRTPLEMQTFLGLSKNNKLTPTINQMVRHGVMRPLARGIYGLRAHGQRIRKRRMRESGRPYHYAELPDVDWEDYAWVMKGQQRRQLIEVMDSKPARAADIIRQAKKKSATTHRAFATLQDFVTRGLAKAVKHSHSVAYALNQKGEPIKQQLLKAWLMFFVCL